MFIVIQTMPDDIALMDLVNGDAKTKGVAVFTDRDGAEEFRDKYHPSFSIAPLSNETAFANLLTILKNVVTEVVFDPYRIGKRTQTITVTEMLAQLPPSTLP